MALVALFLGPRVSEVVGLKWRDIDWERLTISISRSWVEGNVEDTTAVLNFFLPGLGFTYLGSPFFIVTGIAFFVLIVAAMVIGAASPTKATSIADIADAVVSLCIDLIWAAISWEVTNLFNAAQPKATAT